MEASPTPGKKRYTALGVVVGVAAFALSYAAVRHFFFRTPDFQEEMVTMARAINTTCPVTLDAETRLDSVQVRPDNVLRYNYTLLNVTRAQVVLDTVRKYLEPHVVEGVRTQEALEPFRAHRTTFEYQYRDKDAVPVHTIVVTPAQYAHE
jgi:hypothetical protein